MTSANIIFDAMAAYRDEIDAAYSGSLEWQRLDTKKASRLKYEMSAEEAIELGPFKDHSGHQKRIDWYVRELQRFYSIIYPVWEKAQKDINGK